MEFCSNFRPHAETIEAMFKATFTASEGPEEGTLIGGLVLRLMAETPPDALRVFTVWDGGALVGAILFTRLVFADRRTVFMLSPVAVATDRQGEGIGQALIIHGLALLRSEGVDIAVTYGDPAFYGRVGFVPVAESTVPAPHRLQHPEGWLGQSLQDAPLTPLKAPASCVAGFDDSRLW